jgi:hypothetical protein
MSDWLVNQDNGQLTVDSLDSLKKLVSSGKISEADLLQEPGTDSWKYAMEFDELKALFAASSSSTDDDFDYTSSSSGMIKKIMLTLFILVSIVGGWKMKQSYDILATDPGRIIDKSGNSYTKMLVTGENASLLKTPDAGASAIASLEKNTEVTLLGKRESFYKATDKNGTEGWVQIDQVLPLYLLGGKKVREEYDPIYNPLTYVRVRNASWLQLESKASALTVFNFEVKNDSMYHITDLILVATVKDSKGSELEKVEIPVQGIIPAWSSTMVGTLDPERAKRGEEQKQNELMTTYTFNERAEEDPELALRFKTGVEVVMTSKDFSAAEIDIIQLRTIPDAQPKPKRR